MTASRCGGWTAMKTKSNGWFESWALWISRSGGRGGRGGRPSTRGPRSTSILRTLSLVVATDSWMPPRRRRLVRTPPIPPQPTTRMRRSLLFSCFIPLPVPSKVVTGKLTAGSESGDRFAHRAFPPGIPLWEMGLPGSLVPWIGSPVVVCELSSSRLSGPRAATGFDRLPRPTGNESASIVGQAKAREGEKCPLAEGQGAFKELARATGSELW